MNSVHILSIVIFNVIRFEITFTHIGYSLHFSFHQGKDAVTLNREKNEEIRVYCFEHNDTDGGNTWLVLDHRDQHSSDQSAKPGGQFLGVGRLQPWTHSPGETAGKAPCSQTPGDTSR